MAPCFTGAPSSVPPLTRRRRVPERVPHGDGSGRAAHEASALLSRARGRVATPSAVPDGRGPSDERGREASALLCRARGRWRRHPPCPMGEVRATRGGGGFRLLSRARGRWRRHPPCPMGEVRATRGGGRLPPPLSSAWPVATPSAVPDGRGPSDETGRFVKDLGGIRSACGRRADGSECWAPSHTAHGTFSRSSGLHREPEVEDRES